MKIKQLVKIHQEELKGILNELGEDFLMKYYNEVSKSKKYVLFEEKKGNKTIGMAVLRLEESDLMKQILKSDCKHIIKLIQLLIRQPNQIIYIMYIILRIGYNPEIEFIAVDKNHQRKGIGQKLLKKAVNYLKKEGYPCIYVRTDYKNEKGKLFYKKNNFIQIDSEDYLIGKMLVYRAYMGYWR